VAAYRGAIALNSSNARTYIGLGFARQKNKQLAASLEAFHQGLQIADSELSDDLKARGFYGLGQVFEQQGNLAEAIRYYREAIRTEPDHLEAWRSLSQAQQRLLQQHPSSRR
jgi:tetratricopeptide (TPR) repeat protein